MLFLPLLALAPLALAVPHKRAITPIYDGSAVNGQTFDYVIAGGGLAGSVLASRLTEDSNRRVLVIESGYDEEGRPEVTDASKYQSTFDVSRSVDGLTTDIPRLGVPNRSANVGQQPAHDGPLWACAGRQHHDQRHGMEQASLVPDRRDGRTRQRWLELELAAGIHAPGGELSGAI